MLPQGITCAQVILYSRFEQITAASSVNQQPIFEIEISEGKKLKQMKSKKWLSSRSDRFAKM